MTPTNPDIAVSRSRSIADGERNVEFRPNDPETQTRPRGNPPRHEGDIRRGVERFEAVLGR